MKGYVGIYAENIYTKIFVACIQAMLQTMNSIAVWTGLNDRGTEELWHWTSGKPYAFLNWAAGTTV